MTVAQINLRLLRERIERLEEENRQLREMMLPPDNPFYGRLQLSPQMADLVCAFWKHGKMSFEMADTVLSLHKWETRGEDDAACHNRMSVVLCRVRQRLGAHGIKIGNLRGWGFEMSDADREKLISLVTKKTRKRA